MIPFSGYFIVMPAPLPGFLHMNCHYADGVVQIRAAEWSQHCYLLYTEGGYPKITNDRFVMRCTALVEIILCHRRSVVNIDQYGFVEQPYIYILGIEATLFSVILPGFASVTISHAHQKIRLSKSNYEL